MPPDVNTVVESSTATPEISTDLKLTPEQRKDWLSHKGLPNASEAESETDVKTTESSPADKPKPKTPDAQDRIRKITRDNQELRERLARLEGREEGRAKPEPVQAEAKTPPRPTIDQFDSYAEYETQLDKWKDDRYEERLQKRLSDEFGKRESANQGKTEAERKQRDFMKRWQEGRESLAGFDELFEQAKDDSDAPRVSKLFGECLTDGSVCEKPVHLVEYLIKNPEAARKLYSISGKEAMGAAIARIEEREFGSKVKPVARVPRPGHPPEEVTVSTNSRNPDAEQMAAVDEKTEDFRKFKRLHDEQRRKQNRGQ